MTDIESVIAAHRAHGKTTLLIDADVRLLALAKEPNVVVLSKANRKPEELWSIPGRGQFHLAIVSLQRTVTEHFAILSLLEPMIAPGGGITIMPSAVDTTPLVDDDVFRWTSVPEFFQSLGWTIERSDDILTYRKPGAALHGDKRVISLSLFGPDEHYWRALPTYIRAHHALFPGYELRIHHDDHILTAPYGDVLFGLERRNLLKLVRMGEDGIAIGKCQAMLWRLAPAWDPEVEVVFCRDVDALPTWRERKCAEEFIASTHPIGVVHDNPEHMLMLGGLCHLRNIAGSPMWQSFTKFIEGANFNAATWGEHGADQAYLNEIMTNAQPPVLEHSLFIVSTESGEWVHRDGPTLENADFRTTIAEPAQSVIDSVPAIVREKSDSFINYMGAAGRHEEDARAFYAEHCPIKKEICEAEQLAGWPP